MIPDEIRRKKERVAIISILVAIGVVLLFINFNFNSKSDSNDPNEEYKRYFNSSRSELASEIKSKLNDPNSFEFVESKFRDNKDGTLTVIVDFRAKNGFGGIVTQSARATFNKDIKIFTDISIQ